MTKPLETPNYARMAEDDEQLAAHVWWTLHDAWAARDPGAIDKITERTAELAFKADHPGYRDYALMQTLHAGALQDAAGQISERIAAGEIPTIQALDAAVGTAMERRMPMEMLKTVAANVRDANPFQLSLFAANPEVPNEIKPAAKALAKAAGAQPAGPGVRRALAAIQANEPPLA